MLHQFLLYNKVSQLYIYMHKYVFFLKSIFKLKMYAQWERGLP